MLVKDICKYVGLIAIGGIGGCLLTHKKCRNDVDKELAETKIFYMDNALETLAKYTEEMKNEEKLKELSDEELDILFDDMTNRMATVYKIESDSQKIIDYVNIKKEEEDTKEVEENTNEYEKALENIPEKEEKKNIENKNTNKPDILDYAKKLVEKRYEIFTEEEYLEDEHQNTLQDICLTTDGDIDWTSPELEDSAITDDDVKQVLTDLEDYVNDSIDSIDRKYNGKFVYIRDNVSRLDFEMTIE